MISSSTTDTRSSAFGLGMRDKLTAKMTPAEADAAHKKIAPACGGRG